MLQTNFQYYYVFLIWESIYTLQSISKYCAMRGVNGQIPGANQHIERQEVALPKQMHMSVAM